jgi:hypothetical protein
MSEDRRCPSCGALVAADAEWCGQCYAPLHAEQPEPVPAPPAREAPAGEPVAVSTPGGGGVEVAGGRATWECPVCGERNPMEAGVCGMCQTPFARLFEEPTPDRAPRIEPRTAALWSLALPGLGHWKAGLRADGFARMVLFAWTLGTVVVVLLSGSGRGSIGRGMALFSLYLAAAVAIYVVSAIDAYRVADGRPPLVTSRVLLWASAALVLASIVLATFITLPAARG